MLKIAIKRHGIDKIGKKAIAFQIRQYLDICGDLETFRHIPSGYCWIGVEQHSFRLAYTAIGAGERSFKGDLISRCDPAGCSRIHIDRRNVVLRKRKQFARIGDAISVEVAPQPKTAEAFVICINLPVTIRVESPQGGKSVFIGAAKKLGNSVDSAVAVVVMDKKGIVRV
ncbi:hypothetical protein ACU8MP_25430 (plasmid) [Rhizobium leguminosarum]